VPPRFARYWHRFDLADYEWSLRKDQVNLEKHGLDFSVACRIFEGQILRRRDTRTVDEMVFQAIGETAGITLFVVYTVRNHKCQIISARRATSDEARLLIDG
jgi:uncharacterized DUF497 family protein